MIWGTLRTRGSWFWAALVALALLGTARSACAVAAPESTNAFPLPLNAYPDEPGVPLLKTLQHRVQMEPSNLVATILFFLAIIHTFMAPMFTRLSHRYQREHDARLTNAGKLPAQGRGEVSFMAEMFHFLGEVEAVFGIWVVPVLLAITAHKGWRVAQHYISEEVDFTEPLFVVVIMCMAASRPVLKASEQMMSLLARFGRGSPGAWWLAILTVGPILGSFITEPAAMTISALLLAKKFYERRPGTRFAYATLGLLFVNVSVGGTLTHFAAPPVLMVARKWGFGMSQMLTEFGWKAVLGILAGNLLYFLWFRREFKALAPTQSEAPGSLTKESPIPIWITGVHILFLAWTVMTGHYRPLFVGGFMFYLAFVRATEHHQNELALRPALLVGFFLAGLVIHGGLQAWWIAPVLRRLQELPLFFGSALLTAFNDNAAITYLASLVPGFSEPLKYAVVSGAVAGGGLTVIANAPNPAGQSVLARFFPEGVSPLRLFLGALIPTVLVSAAFLLFRV